MGFQDDPNVIRWRLHLKSSPSSVFRLIATDEGRARFWAESARERDGSIEFQFPNGFEWRGEILENRPPHRFSVQYIDGKRATFELAKDRAGGTDLTLTDDSVSPAWRPTGLAGRDSVLLALSAAVDFSVDLRDHDPHRRWDEGNVEN
jgi:uncharacterized protein YndB with AHSA1/START domain